MGLYTWLSEAEQRKYSTVSNKEVNDLLQEVRTLDDGVFLDEKKIHVDTKLFSRRKVYKTLYTMYVREEVGTQVRCMAISSARDAIINYLYGFINGYNKKARENGTAGTHQ